jgi:hypothetical protein
VEDAEEEVEVVVGVGTSVALFNTWWNYQPLQKWLNRTLQE